MKKGIAVLLSIFLAISVFSSLPISTAAKESNTDAISLESTGNATWDAFINDPRFTNGVSWNRNKTPVLVTTTSWAGCAAYCVDYVKYCYNYNYPTYGTLFENINEIRAGDVIVIGNPGNNTGHWFVCLKRYGNNLYVAEGNASGKVRIGWNWSIKNDKYFSEDSARSFTKGYHFTAGPASPAANVSASGTTVTVTWADTTDETGYDVYLVQAPWGWEDIKYQQSVDADSTSCVFYNIPAGTYAAFIIARPNADTAQGSWAFFEASGFNHILLEYEYNLPDHPHYKCYRCTCGDVHPNYNEPVFVEACAECLNTVRPNKVNLLLMNSQYLETEMITFYWNDSNPNATHYRPYFLKKENGEYVHYDYDCPYVQSGYTRSFPAGEYAITIIAYNCNYNEADGSGWLHSEYDPTYFTVLSHEHEWSEWQVSTVPTCTDQGWESRFCAVCNSIESRVTPASGHAWGEWTSAGANTHMHVCTNDPSHVEYADHTWNEGEIIVAPTTSKPGVITYTCTLCGETRMEVLPAIDKTKGDADGDGEITVADALIALRIAAKLAPETPEMITICDTDGDGRITVSDALAILRVAAKLVASL